MSTEPRGRDLFIVDNSVSGWTGLRYLEKWPGIASKAFDIGTGYFEIGARGWRSARSEVAVMGWSGASSGE
jgi:hypothetical protein